jgi:hypothetical protein
MMAVVALLAMAWGGSDSHGLGAGTGEAPAAVSPPAAVPYSMEAPSGPVFPDDVKQQQRDRAKRMRDELGVAFEAGKDSYTVPPGDYRFGKETWGPDGPIFPLEFRGLKRDESHPFRIIAGGATFWFDLPVDQAPQAHFALGFVECSHITLEGATLDRDPRGCLEGRITRIDDAGNRIEIRALPGSIVPGPLGGTLEQRVVPFNADGTFCTALYAVQAMAPARLSYRSIEPGQEPGCHWVSFPAESKLLAVNRDPAWRQAYGDAGTLQVGDGLCVLFTTTVAITVRECEAISFLDVKNYIDKGGTRELGGRGGHRWQGCYFGPRPGTCRWQGGEGILTGCMERGSTFDGITMLHTADDVLDIHGFWGYVKQVAGRTIVIQKDHQMPAQPGDPLTFFDAQMGVPVGTAVVTEVVGQTLTLDREAAAFVGAVAENPRRQSAGWAVRDSTFQDCYQRLLVQGGNGGTLRGNRFVRMGSCIELHSNFFTGNEGGICRDITILDNVLQDVAIHPEGTTLRVGFQSLNHAATTPLLSGITVRGNRFIRSGRHGIEFALVAGGEISGNTFVDPGLPRILANQAGGDSGLQPIQIRDSTGITLRGNRIISRRATPPAASTGSPLFGTSGTVTGIVGEP